MILTRRWRIACTVLQVVPVPGVGAMVAGAKNPHTRLLQHGILQAALVIFGSFPLILPGAVGLGWAIYDATKIWAAREPGPRSIPLDGPTD